MNAKKKKKKALDKTQHPFLAKVKDRTAWTSPVTWRASTKPSNLLTACLTVTHCTSPQASSRLSALRTLEAPASAIRQDKEKASKSERKQHCLYSQMEHPEGSIKRLLEGVARCKINIQKSIVPATYNQEMN